MKHITIAAVAALALTLAACSKDPEADNTVVNGADASAATEVPAEPSPVGPGAGGGKPAEAVHPQQK